MTELQGAIGKVQLDKLAKMVEDNKERYLVLEKFWVKIFNQEINKWRITYF